MSNLSQQDGPRGARVNRRALGTYGADGRVSPQSRMRLRYRDVRRPRPSDIPAEGGPVPPPVTGNTAVRRASHRPGADGIPRHRDHVVSPVWPRSSPRYSLASASTAWQCRERWRSAWAPRLAAAATATTSGGASR